MAEMSNNDSRISRQPSTKDPNEIRIRHELDLLLDNAWSRKLFLDFTKKQSLFLRSSIKELNDSSRIHKNYHELLNTLAVDGKSHIVDGVQFLDLLPKEKGFVVFTNHFGSAKLSRIPTKELGIEIPGLSEVEPFPVRPAPLNIVAELTKSSLHECAAELPEPLNMVQEASGVITISASGEGRTQALTEKFQRLSIDEIKPMIVIYPEGGTTGKRNGKGPYTLEELHTGGLVSAIKAGFPVLPVSQYFDSQTGFELRISKPLVLTESDLSNLYQIIENIGVDLQESLDASQSK